MLPLHDNVEVPLVCVPVRETLVGDRLQVRPVDGDTVVARPTLPANPCKPPTVMAEVPAAPTFEPVLVGLADTEKSWTT